MALVIKCGFLKCSDNVMKINCVCINLFRECIWMINFWLLQKDSFKWFFITWRMKWRISFLPGYRAFIRDPCLILLTFINAAFCCHDFCFCDKSASHAFVKLSGFSLSKFFSPLFFKSPNKINFWFSRNKFLDIITVKWI